MSNMRLTREGCIEIDSRRRDYEETVFSPSQVADSKLNSGILLGYHLQELFVTDCVNAKRLWPQDTADGVHEGLHEGLHGGLHVKGSKHVFFFLVG